jgi:hypothetical protein
MSFGKFYADLWRWLFDSCNFLCMFYVWIGICIGGPVPHPGGILYESMGDKCDNDQDDDNIINIIDHKL